MIKSQPFLTENDLQKLLNSPVKCHPSQKFLMNTLIQLLWDSGARISELTNLKVEDFDPTQRFLTLRNTKNKQDRIIPITNSMTKSLARIVVKRKEGYIFSGRDGRPMSRISAYAALKRRVTASGINKNIRPHTFRHHWITSKLDKGVPLPQVQKFVGHTSLSSTSLYYHFTQEDLRKALEA
ncbi:tyrosine-type recombinase/integrase [Patescibacteria group bacterium]